MKKDEWGIKRICQSCGLRFYDLKRRPIVCPSCGAVFDELSILKKKKSSGEASDEILEDDIIAEEIAEDDEEVDLDDESEKA